MAYDPSDPETLEELHVDEAPEIDVEAPEGDTAEQQADVAEERDEEPLTVDADRANEADLIEQARVVSLDEDDYR